MIILMSYKYRCVLLYNHFKQRGWFNLAGLGGIFLPLLSLSLKKSEASQEKVLTHF